MLIDAADDALHGVVGERADGVDAVLFLDLLLAREHRVHRHGPVDDLRCGYPRQELPVLDLRAVLRRVRAFRPFDGLPVAAGYQHKALARGRRAVVGGDELAVLDLIA